MPSYDLAELRQQIPGLQSCTYLNTGTFGIMAQPVFDQLMKLMAEAELQGSPGYHEVQKKMRHTRVQLATLLGCHADELAFTENATHGLNIPAFGLPLGPKDTVLLSGEEYPICEHIFRYREQNGGPRLKFFKIEHNPQDTLENLDLAWDSSVRCVMVSAVTCETAVRLPVKEICDFAKYKMAWSVVDMAQAVGQYPIHLHDLGCDMALGGGHKWLHGPKGTGWFYARKEVIPQLRPMWVSHTALRDPITHEVFIPNDRRRFELVGRPYALFAGLSPAIEWLDKLGWSNIWHHQADMRERMCREIEKREGFRLLSPRIFEQSSSLVTFRMPCVDEKNVDAYVRDAWEKARIYLRASPLTGGIRLSASYFTNLEDIERLFHYLDRK